MKTAGPVWIVQPETPADVDKFPHPEHPIVLPPDTPDDNPPGIWGGGNEGFPTPPIVIPDPGGDRPHPEHPIVLPPNTIWPDPPEGEFVPTHPIVLPEPPDGGDAEEPSGAPTFYQRKTLGINWSADFDESAVVGIYAGAGDDDPILVRTVANDGTSSVTYPQDFTGPVTIRVVGGDAYLEGTTEVV